MRNIAWVVIKKTWLDWTWMLAAFVGWDLSVRYTEQLLGGNSVAGFIVDALLYVTCIVRGAIALDRSMFVVVNEPRQLTVALTARRFVSNKKGLLYEYRFGGGLVRFPATTCNLAHPGDQVSFWYRPIDTIVGPVTTIYTQSWGLTLADVKSA